jgi:hypothetical protein
VKRHADQIRADKFADSVLSSNGIQRITLNPVSCYAREPGDFVMCVCAKGPEGEQHNYMMQMSRYECDHFKLDPMDSYRELMPQCQILEIETRKRRELFAKMMAEQIAYALLDHIEKNDPQFGYTREQWDEMKRQ